MRVTHDQVLEEMARRVMRHRPKTNPKALARLVMYWYKHSAWSRVQILDYIWKDVSYGWPVNLRKWLHS